MTIKILSRRTLNKFEDPYSDDNTYLLAEGVLEKEEQKYQYELAMDSSNNLSLSLTIYYVDGEYNTINLHKRQYVEDIYDSPYITTNGKLSTEQFIEWFGGKEILIELIKKIRSMHNTGTTLVPFVYKKEGFLEIDNYMQEDIDETNYKDFISSSSTDFELLIKEKK